MVAHQPPGPQSQTVSMVTSITREDDGCVTGTVVVTGIGDGRFVFDVKYATNMSNPQIVALAGEGLACLARGFTLDEVWDVLADAWHPFD